MRTYSWIIVACAVSFASTNLAVAHDETHENASPEAMMQAWQQMMAPNENHKKLEFFVGKWEGTVRSWMEGPDKPPVESKGTSDSISMYGGRYVKDTFSSEMMGQKFEGTSLFAYDNFRKHYTSVWFDSMSTGIMTMSGSFDSSGKVLTMYGQSDDPMTGHVAKHMRAVYRIVDDNHYVFEMYDLAVGESVKMMEISYKRRK
ncbi:MAG: DUF1579 domain-containing protein [Myxococcales bacterium]|nr:DUF1579 domain-containing protein [Myxococcales bacterium]